MRKIFLVIIFVYTLFLYSEETGIVKRDRAVLRNGPGSIFEIIAELAQGTSFNILEKENGWLNIEVDTLNGFVSKKVTEERKAQKDIFAMMGTQETTLRVSQHGMSAGVKGFAERFTQKFDGNPAFIELYTSLKISPVGYEQFKKETYYDYDLYLVDNYPIPVSEVKDYFSFSEEGMGFGIASRIASIGIYQDPELTEYINYVGNLIVEATEVYDINFKFFILDTEKVNAYACPGGIIFITKGLLKTMINEAELAGVLAHEIAHVARHHGMMELEERKYHIKADDVFAEMDEELEKVGSGYDEDTKEIEAEMEELAFEIYETIFNGRLEEYEEEADFLAMIYSLRAGYQYRQLLNLLKKIYIADCESTNEHYTRDQISKRIDDLEKNKEKIKVSSNILFMDNQERFLRVQNLLFQE